MKQSKVLLAGLVLGLAATLSTVTQAAPATSRIYAVTKVAPDDGLNLRSEPGLAGRVLVVLPANAKGVLSLGVEKKTGNSVWLRVSWAGKEGWVNKYYLREDVDTSRYNPAQPRAVVATPAATPAAPSTSSAATASPAAPRPASPTKAEVVMECGGTEPFWSVTISERDLKVNLLDGPNYTVPVSLRQQSANSKSIAVVAGQRSGAATTAFLEKVETCSDGMSDKNYPYAITAVLNAQKVVSGCCAIAGAQQ